MSILDEIMAQKRREVDDRRRSNPVNRLEGSEFFSSKTRSLCGALKEEAQTGIIAEIKRRSPSRGWLNADADVARISTGYEEAGVAGISVLTDTPYFAGSSQDLVTARRHISRPILRKDFIFDEYQVFETKAMGADVMLLIAAALNTDTIGRLTRLGQSLGLEVLLEVHSEEELEANIGTGPDLVGINNRNLSTFEVNLQTSYHLVDKIPAGIARISESGIDTPATVLALKDLGFNGFLMGEGFMKHEHPEIACSEFHGALKLLAKR